MYQLQNISFKGKSYKIICQSEKGASPLLAIANTLILKDLIGLSGPNQSISSAALQSLVGAALRKTSAQLAKSFEPSLVGHLSRNIDASIARLPEFESKMALAVGFSAVDEFPICDALSVFETLGLSLCHAWLADPSEPFAALAKAEKLSSMPSVDRAAPSHQAEQAKQAWMAEHRSQITPRGLSQLLAQVPPDQLRIFYCDGAFHTLYRHFSGDGLFLLATQPASPLEAWRSLDVLGRGVPCDASFQPLAVAAAASSPPPQQTAAVDASPSSSPSSSLLAGSSVAGQPKKVIVIENVLTRETKTLRLPRWPTTYDALRRFVQTLFKELPSSFSVTYRDPDNDFISITTPAEFDEAIRLATETNTNELQIRVGPSLSSVVMSSLPLPSPSSSTTTPSSPMTPVGQPGMAIDAPLGSSPAPAPSPSVTTPIKPSPAINNPNNNNNSGNNNPHTPISLPQSSNTSSPSSTPSKPSETSALVPQWFADRVSSIFDSGHCYPPSLIIESLIRNAADADETIAEPTSTASPRTSRWPWSRSWPSSPSTPTHAPPR